MTRKSNAARKTTESFVQPTLSDLEGTGPIVEMSEEDVYGTDYKDDEVAVPFDQSAIETIETEVTETEEIVTPTNVNEVVVEEPTFDLNDLMATHGNNKSAVMRFLSSENWPTSKIAKFMGVKYQFVRNVLNTAAEKAKKD